MTNTECLTDLFHKFVQFNPSYMCRHLNMECQKLDQNTLANKHQNYQIYLFRNSVPSSPPCTDIGTSRECLYMCHRWNTERQEPDQWYTHSHLQNITEKHFFYLGQRLFHSFWAEPIIRWVKTGDPQEKPPDNPQAELGLSNMWPEPGLEPTAVKWWAM